MNRALSVMAIVEGQTEVNFVKDILAPYLGMQGIFITPTVLSKPGQKGGDVRFVRAQRDIAKHLKQRGDTYVSLLLDYYGLGSDWPGLAAAQQQRDPKGVSTAICAATQAAVDAELREHRSGERFVPYVSMHEFEALLFSEPSSLAAALQVKQQRIEAIIAECGEPEAIDSSAATAPSKRIAQLQPRFKKSTDSIAIAKAIGIPRIRAQCPLFNAWLSRLESLPELGPDQ